MRPKLTFSPAQVRAGRALLNLAVETLAERARLEPEAIELYESGAGDLSPAEQWALGQALYADGTGVIAIPAERAGEGVRLALPHSPGSGLPAVAINHPALQLGGRGRGDW